MVVIILMDAERLNNLVPGWNLDKLTKATLQVLEEALRVPVVEEMSILENLFELWTREPSFLDRLNGIEMPKSSLGRMLTFKPRAHPQKAEEKMKE